MTLRRDLDQFLPIGHVGKIFVLSFLLINLIALNASSVPIIPDPGVTVTPRSICCGDCITVTIPVENLRSVTVHGRIEVYIVDAKGYSNQQNSLSITLYPNETTRFTTVICPREPCNSFGTYKVIAKIVEDNGKVHDTDSAYFTVNDCGPSCDTGWTQTYRCNGNILERLYVNDDCSEEWRTWKDCSSQNPPCECKYGLCVPIEDDPDPGNGGTTCNQWECQSQNKPIGASYLKNGKLFQKWYECNCVDGKCKCESVEKEVPCEGSISGHVYDSNTRSPITGASILMCQGGGSCLALPRVDSYGVYSTGEAICPYTTYEIICSADGYKSDTTTVTSNENGNSWVDFALVPESCEVKFRGEVVQGGEDESVQAISFYEFVIKITEILDDDSGSLNVGAKVGVSSHRNGKARVDTVYNGDRVEVFGVNMVEGGGNQRHGSITDALVVLSESWDDGEGYYLTLKAQGNRPPKIISLTPDKDDPQKSGSRITWTAKAEDNDGDPIMYKFEHKGPLMGDAYRTVKDWSTDNIWTWNVDSDYVGENYVKVSVRDGNHKDVDEFTNVKYTIEPPPDEIKFVGTVFSGRSPMGFVVYYLRVDEILEGPSEVKVGDAVSVEVYCSAYPLDRGGRYDRLEVGDRAEVYARIDTSKGKWNDGYEIAWKTSITSDSKYYVNIIRPALSINVWTDKDEYEVGEEVTIHYELNIEDAARRITVGEQGTQTPLFTKTFGENTFSKEKSGFRKLVIDKPGTYVVKLEVWILDSDHMESDLVEFDVQYNQPPKLISLTSNLKTPTDGIAQFLSGSIIKWTAIAEDPENDEIKYRFELKGTATGDTYHVVRDWSTGNTWTWNTGLDDVGYNEIKVSVHDDKHDEVVESEPTKVVCKSRFLYLAKYWSPIINQDVSKDNPKVDYILKFNFDGENDFNAWNNEENLETMGLKEIVGLGAHVYYWVVESSTHYFIGYGIFHPVDLKEIKGHENDFEGVILCIQKDPNDSNGPGNFYKMKTIAHTYENVYESSDVKFINEVHDLDEKMIIAMHPIVYVEPKMHGVYGTDDLLKTAGTQVGISEIPIFTDFVLTGSVKTLFSGAKEILGDICDGIGIAYVNSTKSGVEQNPPHEWPEEKEFNWPLVDYKLVPINELWDMCRTGKFGEGTPYYDELSFGGDNGPLDGKAHPPWGWSCYGENSNAFLDPVNLFGLQSSEIISRSYTYP